jgi:hypothetical protein
MRIALPIDMPYKTRSEVDTMTFISRTVRVSHPEEGGAETQTSVPLPRVYSSDPTNGNVLRFPYILMDFVAGAMVADPCMSLSDDGKTQLVVSLAHHYAELFGQTFSTIGALRQTPLASPLTAAILMVSIAATMIITPHLLLAALITWALWVVFSCSSRRGYRPDCISRAETHFLDGLTPRGPFRNSHDWLRARLEACLTRHASDPTVVEMTHRMLRSLPILFPATAIEITVLCHVPFDDDLHEGNVLIDADGKPVAILDWEFASVLPAWYACSPPLVCLGQRIPKPELDNTQYDNDMYQHEMFNIYRPIFEQTIERLQPRWMEISRHCELERDFENAMTYLEKGYPQTEQHHASWDGFEEELRVRGPMHHLWAR